MFLLVSTPDSSHRTQAMQQQQHQKEEEEEATHSQQQQQHPVTPPRAAVASPPPPNKTLLTFSSVAKLFLKLKFRESHEGSGNVESAPPSSLPTSSPVVPSSSQQTQEHQAPLGPTVTVPHDPSSSSPSSSSSTPQQQRVKRVLQESPSSFNRSATFPSFHVFPVSHSASLPASSSSSSPSSPGSSPAKHRTRRSESSSGLAPLSHPGLAENACERREPVERTDTYVCAGGVNVPILLRTTRTELMGTVSILGANALVDEQWKCIICGLKNRNKATYKVEIRYKARATRSTIADPNQPVALDQTHNIPGLMTVLRRND